MTQSFDWPTMLATNQNNKQVAQELLVMFQQEIDLCQSQLPNAQQQNDWELIGQLAHKMRGGCVYCGTPKLAMICEKLEQAIELNDREPVKNHLCERLIKELAHVKKLIEQHQHDHA